MIQNVVGFSEKSQNSTQCSAVSFSAIGMVGGAKHTYFLHSFRKRNFGRHLVNRTFFTRVLLVDFAVFYVILGKSDFTFCCFFVFLRNAGQKRCKTISVSGHTHKMSVAYIVGKT